MEYKVLLPGDRVSNPAYATLDKNGWTLESVVEIYAAYPDKVTILSEEERSSVQVGDMVQLRFLILESGDDLDHLEVEPESEGDRENEEGGPMLRAMGESMWVTVDDIRRERGSIHYIGTLENSPITSEVLEAGDTIVFGPEHVANWWKNPPRG